MIPIPALIAVLFAAITLAACSASTPPPSSVAATVAIADVTLPPPAEVSPTASTISDDVAIIRAFQGLDIAATAADTILALRPNFAGTEPALRLASALDGARTWLNIASGLDRASQADSYSAALEQAAAALAGARDALADLKTEN